MARRSHGDDDTGWQSRRGDFRQIFSVDSDISIGKSKSRQPRQLPLQSSLWKDLPKRRFQGLLTAVSIVFTASFFCASYCLFYPTRNAWYNSGNYVIKDCQKLTLTKTLDTSGLSPKRKERFERVQQAIQRAWARYARAILSDTRKEGGSIHHDDHLSSNPKFGRSWLHHSAVIHDSLDMLFLANMTSEYERVVHLLTDYDSQCSSPQLINTYDYSSRIIGGLLGAYSLSGDPRLFAAARNAADALLEGPFEASPTILPRPFTVLAPPIYSSSLSSSTSPLFTRLCDWKAGLQRLWRGLNYIRLNSPTTILLSEIGSFGLEFSFLTSISGDPKYRRASDTIFRHIEKYIQDSMVPNLWNLESGLPEMDQSRTDSGMVSMFDILIKVPALNRCKYDFGMEMYVDSCLVSDKDQLEHCERMMKNALQHLQGNTEGIDHHGNPVFLVSNENRLDHQFCSLPTLLALGASLADETNLKNNIEQAQELLHGCSAGCKSGTGLSVRTGEFSRDHLAQSKLSIYLRPEYIESLFVLYRLTLDDQIQDEAWEVFECLEEYYFNIDDGSGYSALKDVDDLTSGPRHIDGTPTYFLSAKLKYLLLVFGPDDYVALDDFVFTAMGHPLRKKETDKRKNKSPPCILQTVPPMPIPWFLIFLSATLVTASLCCFYVLWQLLKRGIVLLIHDKNKFL
jgi:hypothetical protein